MVRENPAIGSGALDDSCAAIMKCTVLRKAYRIAAEKKTGIKQMKIALVSLGQSTDEAWMMAVSINNGC